MSKLSTLKDHFKESQLYLNRVLAAVVIVLILILLLLFRLAFLQIYQHDLYKTLSLNNQVRILPVTPTRGLIYDRNGILLAENLPVFSLEITPERNPNIPETIAALEKFLNISETEKQQFFKQVKYKKRSEALPIKVKLTEEEVARFSLEKHHFPGVEIQARLIRHYPLGDMFAHVLGYIGPISEKDLEKIDPAQYRGSYYIGKTGIEKFYEHKLRGMVGYQHIETDARGRTIRILSRKAPIAGTHLHLAIDSRLQLKAYQALAEFKGAVVALDPQSGDILTMVSNPTYDPNLFTQGIDNKTYQLLQNSSDRPLFNRVLQGQYPPGSTIKPLVAIQALEQGFITPQFGLFDPGWYQLNGNGRLFRDWIYHSKRHGHGWVDLEKAIMQSCDTYFFSVAHKMGIKPLQEVFTRFGLGAITEIDSTGERPGLVPSIEIKKLKRNEDWYAGDTLNVGIGQGMMLSTPLQLAQMTAILANRGKRFKPRLVTKFSKISEIEALDTVPLLELSPILLKNENNYDIIIRAMQTVVHSPAGTAYRACQGIKYSLAGKTGTAQVFTIKQNEKYEVAKVKSHLRDHSWFIGFAPIDNPSIAIAVLVENKHTKTAADVARIVLDHYFQMHQSIKQGVALPSSTAQNTADESSRASESLKESLLSAEEE